MAATTSVIIFDQQQSSDYAEDSSSWFTTCTDEEIRTPVYRKMTSAERAFYRVPRREGLIVYEDLMRCCCTACWSIWSPLRDHRSESQMKFATKNFANRHCASCMCRDCVCDYKRSRGLFEDNVTCADASSDNFCDGSCVICAHFAREAK